MVCPLCGHEWEPGGVVTIGTKVRGIRLITDGGGDHDIDAKVPGIGQMQLKSSIVKKVL